MGRGHKSFDMVIGSAYTAMPSQYTTKLNLNPRPYPLRGKCLVTVPELQSDWCMEIPQRRPKDSSDPFPRKRWGLGMSLLCLKTACCDNHT